MLETEPHELKVEYRSLVIIWLAVVVFQILLFALTLWDKPELFSFAPQQNVLGEDWIVVIIALIAGLQGLVFSFIYRSRYLRQSIAEQKAETVQTALITAIALSSSCVFWGVFLAFGFEYRYFFIWMAVGFLVTIIHFPLRSNLQKASKHKPVVQ